MTRDEVMALTDEELRIKAAELVGWADIRGPDRYSPWTGVPPHVEIGGPAWVLPDYPYSIAAAWELVVKMKGEPASVFSLKQDWWKEEYRAVFHGVDEDSGGQMMATPWYQAEGDTAPRAITRAFILAMTHSAAIKRAEAE